VQTYAAGFDIRLPLVVVALRAALDPTCIVEKNDFRLRELEGLPRREGVLFGTPDPGLRIRESGVSFGVDIAAGQKTGYYFDHRLTRQRARALAAGRSVLDVFSYTGSFAVNAALGGAREVVAVDASQSACRLAERNAALNDVAGRCTFAVGNAFEYLAELGRQGRRFGLICLDPPAFIKSRREHAAGLRGYRQLNGLAMRLLDSGGILISSSCSHHLLWPELLGVLMQAAEDAGRSFVILDRLTQGPDHPVLLSMPESEYLRCLVLQVV
jgi:23S rRNA (cytosine1962-C5)-methyltransferase